MTDDIIILSSLLCFPFYVCYSICSHAPLVIAECLLCICCSVSVLCDSGTVHVCTHTCTTLNFHYASLKYVTPCVVRHACLSSV